MISVSPQYPNPRHFGQTIVSPLAVRRPVSPLPLQVLQGFVPGCVSCLVTSQLLFLLFLIPIAFPSPGCVRR